MTNTNPEKTVEQLRDAYLAAVLHYQNLRAEQAPMFALNKARNAMMDALAALDDARKGA